MWIFSNIAYGCPDYFGRQYDCFFDHARIAFEVNSVPWSEAIMSGLPRRPIRSVKSRTTRRPEIEVCNGCSASTFGEVGQGFAERRFCRDTGAVMDELGMHVGYQ